ncbi:DeoR family transcriptional regulator [Streptomyces sp. PT12]|uniref:substrate-binding domain-containing protein n=1 Tax=Streptomyces sp. PT12 TaxID=1510197 RepID=UPI0034D95608
MPVEVSNQSAPACQASPAIRAASLAWTVERLTPGCSSRTRSARSRNSSLAARFGVSAGRIRRDLAELAALGPLTKVRGGAITAAPAEESRHEPRHEPVFADGEGPTLGLLVPSATYYYPNGVDYPNVVDGVRAVAAPRGARIVIGLTDYAPTRDLEQIDELCASGADGLLIASANGHYVPEATPERPRATGKPFVLMERHPEDPYEPCEFVVSDHRQGAYRAVDHLRALGHDRSHAT